MYKPSTHALTDVWAYDPQTDFWTNRAPCPPPATFSGSVRRGRGRDYLRSAAAARACRALWCRRSQRDNPRTDTWTNGANIPTGRGALAACAVEGIIYAIGGSIDGNQQLSTVEADDPRSNHWTTKHSMPQGRYFVTASVVNGLIYVFQGTDVFAYDPKTDSWTTKTNHFSPYSWGLMSAEVEGTIYLFGGFTQDWSDGNNFTLAYDPAGVNSLPDGRCPGSVAPPPVGSSGAKLTRPLERAKNPSGTPMPSFTRRSTH